MRVICIDSKNIDPCWTCETNSNDPVENEVYEIVGQTPRSYILKGKDVCSCGQRHAFSKHRFIPLSEIDEKEFERKYSIVVNEVDN